MKTLDSNKLKVWAVDLDLTLCSGVRSPILDAIDKVNKLFEDPENFIVIYTARSYNIFQETRRWLLDNRVNHHALVMEKIRATAYIDDKHVSMTE